MSRKKVVYVCTHCGAQSSKWQGKCFECGEFGTFEKREVAQPSRFERKREAHSLARELAPLNQVKTSASVRLATGMSGVDRVLGGGVVPGSTVLLAGGPGLGKSTLLLQLSSKIGTEAPTLYISAEESVEQIKLKCQRLPVDEERVVVVSENDVATIKSLIQELSSRIGLVVVDSVQALVSTASASFAGSVTQVRESAREISLLCKKLSLPLFLVGHITKQGAIAGPKTLEHLVDVVLYLEGDKYSKLRLLRGLKNRFGTVFGVDVFRMEDKGLVEVEDASAELLSERRAGAPGSAVAVSLEGLRPLVVEVQALTVPCGYEKPVRNVTGIDYKRLLMLLAVLQKRGGINLSPQNVFVNLSGGVRILETGIDLPICLALASSSKNREIDEKTVAFGEVGLLGEIKRVSYQKERREEAERMGFTKVISSENAPSLREALKML